MKTLILTMTLAISAPFLYANDSQPKEFKTLRKGVPYSTSKKIMEKKGWTASNTLSGEKCDSEWKEVCCEEGNEKCSVQFKKEDKLVHLHLRKDPDKKAFFISEDFKQ